MSATTTYTIIIDAQHAALLRKAVGRLIETTGVDREAPRPIKDWYTDDNQLLLLEHMLRLNGTNALEPSPAINGFVL